MRDKQKLLRCLPVVMDACIIVLAFLLAYYLRFYSPFFLEELAYYYPISRYMVLLFYVIPTYLVIYYEFRLYSDHMEGRKWNNIVSLTLANVVGMILFFCVLYLWKEYDISRKFLLLFFIINIIFGIGSRMVMKFQSKLRQKRR